MGWETAYLVEDKFGSTYLVAGFQSNLVNLRSGFQSNLAGWGLVSAVVEQAEGWVW